MLSSAYVFGIGEHSKETLMHDMNYKTWPMFASHNHPYGAGVIKKTNSIFKIKTKRSF